VADANADRVAAALGPDLNPGETVSATIDDARAQTHDGHIDSYEIHKDESGNVTVDKWHHREPADDKRNWW
jgi:hypothetical protein